MLIPLYNSLPEPSAASAQGVRCLSSEHAVIAKEQTAQAIANTAHAYEKSGVEAALSEVGMTEDAQLLKGRDVSSRFQFSRISVTLCLCCIYFFCSSLTHSLHSAATA